MRSKDVMTIDQDKNRERVFLLSLDPQGGQELAAMAGFVPASPSVAFAETRNILRNWTKLHVLGVGHSVEEYSEWFIQAIEKVIDTEMPEVVKLQQQATLLTFAMASMMALHREGVITINEMDDMKLSEVYIDAKTKQKVVPETYSAIMAEFEELLKDKRLVAEPTPIVKPEEVTEDE